MIGMVSCRGVERDLKKLADCLNAFRWELQGRAGVDLVFSLEPRAVSMIFGPHVELKVSDKREPR